MKTYFRLLSFAKPIEKFAIPYVLTTALSILFSTLNLALLAPLLNTLFLTKDPCEAGCQTASSAPSASSGGIMGYFDQGVQYSLVHFGGQWGALKMVCAAIIVSVLLANIFRYLSQRIMENLKAHTLLNLRSTVFNNVMDLHLGYFNNERKGDIIAKVTSDVTVVQYSVTSTLQVVFKEPLTMLVYLGLLFNISAKLTLVSLLIIPVAGFAIGRIAKKLKQQAASSQESFGLMISYLDEALSGIKIIKAYNAAFKIKDRFNSENRHYTDLSKAMARRQQLASPLSEFLSVSMVAGIVLYGGYLIINNDSSRLDAAAFVTYIALFSQIMRPAKAMTDAFSNIHQGIAAGERVLGLIDTEPAIKDAPDAVTVSGFNTAISIRDVRFAYGERVILDHVSLDIPAGKTIALVGPSGGGKSTLMDLLPRFTEPMSGTILFDGLPLNKITMHSLRQQMGFVNQESILFNDTIFNNIAFGQPGATAAEVENAARIANAHDFILQTPNGYQTNIGDRGVKLSGGQKQRISIARAVLANPPIMLLDEATSALDTESEKLVQDALTNLMKDRTTLVIAHRLSTIQKADVILVLEGGRIIERGTHAELIGNNGLYKRLIDMQQFES